MKEIPLDDLKKMAWAGTPLPENALISDQMYYMYMCMIADYYRLKETKNKEKDAELKKECQGMQMKACKIYNHYRLLERISDENTRRYRALYDKIRGSKKTDCPICNGMLNVLSGLQNYNWEEYTSSED